MSPNTTPLDLPVHNPPQGVDRIGGAIGEQVQPPAPVNRIELRLEPSPARPRQLIMTLLTAHHILWVDARVNHFLCSSAHRLLANCYLNFNDGYPFLSLDDATFSVSVEEATRIQATFEPLGLQIREAK